MDWPKLKPALVPDLIRYFLLEMQRQTGLARDAMPHLLEAVIAQDGYRAFGLLNTILHHGTQAFHIAWPSKMGYDTERRRWVRVALDLRPARFEKFDRSFRNAVAHFDERMDLAIWSSLRNGELAMATAPMSDRVYPSVERFADETYGADLGVFMQRVATEDDPNSIEVRLFGERFDLLAMMDRVNELYGRSEEALDSDRISSLWVDSKGEISQAEALAFSGGDSNTSR